MNNAKVLRALMISSMLTMGVGFAAAEEVVIGYIPASLEYPYNVATAKGFEEMAKELGAKALIVDPRGSVEKQANAIDDLVAQGAQGIAALTLDGVVGQTWVDKLAEQNIPYVSVATQIGDPEKRAWNDVYPAMAALVGMDNVRAGELSGELAAEMLPKDRTVKIAIIEGAPGYPQVWQRSNGFKAGLDKAGIKYEIVSSQPTDWTPESGESVCQNVLTATPDLDLFFSQADDMAIGCNRALEAAGSDVLLIATGGGSKLGLAAVEAGEIDASVCDRPEYQGRLAAKALYDAVTNPDTPKGRLVSYDTPKVTKASLADCPPEW
jgi:ribose transport system substrate-binding protein